MKEIHISISGHDIIQTEAQKIGELLAQRGNPETMVISRFNKQTNSCSPCSLKGNIGEMPGWEVYGENHGGRLKVSVNGGQYVFIFS